MSRYFVLFILNVPFVIAGFVNALVAHKLGKLSKQRFLLHVLFWAVVLVGLLSAELIYEYLFSNNLTDTEPLSLFDVIQITGIVMIFFLSMRTRAKVESLERRVNDLHQELSIKLSVRKDTKVSKKS